MINKLKIKFGLTISIISIILGSLEIIGGLYTIIDFAELFKEMEETFTKILYVCSIIDIAIGASMLSVAIIILKKQSHENVKDYYIALIVFCSILFICTLIAKNYIAMTIYIIYLGLIITTLVLPYYIFEKNTTDESTNNLEDSQSEKNLTNDIQQLKKFKELGIITEEQYNNAIKTIFNNFVDKT